MHRHDLLLHHFHAQPLSSSDGDLQSSRPVQELASNSVKGPTVHRPSGIERSFLSTTLTPLMLLQSSTDFGNSPAANKEAACGVGLGGRGLRQKPETAFPAGLAVRRRNKKHGLK
nr:hypothetical protein Iba_chr02dCG1840 [Ipomoea batatas]